MISLESVEEPAPVEEPVEPPAEPVEETAEEAAPEPESVPEPPAVAAPKRRGRPPVAKEKAKPKAKSRIRKPPTPEESSSEEDVPINRDDMDTMLLQYLLQRKHAQRDSRRAMWAQMAGLS